MQEDIVMTARSRWDSRDGGQLEPACSSSEMKNIYIFKKSQLYRVVKWQLSPSDIQVTSSWSRISEDPIIQAI
jgi:hypothetical protein